MNVHLLSVFGLFALAHAGDIEEATILSCSSSVQELEQMAVQSRSESLSAVLSRFDHQSESAADTVFISETESKDPWMPIHKIQAMVPLVHYAELCLHRPGHGSMPVDRRLLDLSHFCSFSEGSESAVLRQELFDLINSSDFHRRFEILHSLFFLSLRADQISLILEQCGDIIGDDLIRCASISSESVREFLSCTFDSIWDQTRLLLSAIRKVDIGALGTIENLIMSCEPMSFPHLISHIILSQ